MVQESWFSTYLLSWLQMRLRLRWRRWTAIKSYRENVLHEIGLNLNYFLPR